jgi:(p)ppGpp synthase/HD superfamily hydrolase
MKIGSAMLIAAQVHQNQLDLAGKAYIFHPIRVSQNVVIVDDSQRALALLHDTLEDYDRTKLPNLPSIIEKGLTAIELSALHALTHGDKVSWDTYISNIAENLLASRVKIADLEDNMNLLRLRHLSSKALDRAKKYHESWVFLNKTIKRV